VHDDDAHDPIRYTALSECQYHHCLPLDTRSPFVAALGFHVSLRESVNEPTRINFVLS
jgi:hypothetical protein